jgi:hypothetical protein
MYRKVCSKRSGPTTVGSSTGRPAFEQRGAGRQRLLLARLLVDVKDGRVADDGELGRLFRCKGRAEEAVLPGRRAGWAREVTERAVREADGGQQDDVEEDARATVREGLESQNNESNTARLEAGTDQRKKVDRVDCGCSWVRSIEGGDEGGAFSAGGRSSEALPLDGEAGPTRATSRQASLVVQTNEWTPLLAETNIGSDGWGGAEESVGLS